MSLASFDPQLHHWIFQEQLRQQSQITLIASENYASKEVMLINGTELTNKYAEGYPGRRYYAGCAIVDEIETLAIERAKALFDAEYANVQPHSGSQANAAVFLALLNPGDVILGMGLNAGGHLTHGCGVNFSGQQYKAVAYGLDHETGDIDYSALRQLAHEHKPAMIIAGFSAFSGTLQWQTFREIADEVGALLLGDIAHIAGLIACGLSPNPLPWVDVATSTTHKTLRGPRGGLILAGKQSKVIDTLNKGIFPGTQGGPCMHTIAAKALAFKEAQLPSFRDYQCQVIANANAMMVKLHEKGIKTVMPKTDNHQFSIDLSAYDESGKFYEKLLENVGIILNKNTIPGDLRSPFQTSGLRIGTPAMTTRGMRIEQAHLIAQYISTIIKHPKDQSIHDDIAEHVRELCKAFPIHGQITQHINNH